MDPARSRRSFVWGCSTDGLHRQRSPAKRGYAITFGRVGWRRPFGDRARFPPDFFRPVLRLDDAGDYYASGTDLDTDYDHSYSWGQGNG
jgi:hypothetical protein